MFVHVKAQAVEREREREMSLLALLRNLLSLQRAIPEWSATRTLFS
jgi:hypothetical protein